MSRHPVTLPRVSLLSFDPTAHAADQKKDATGEAARPVGEAMLQTITRRSDAPRGNQQNSGRGDGLDRARAHAHQWLAEGVKRGECEVFSDHFPITPEIAALLLQKNPENRHVSKRRIAEIRADLEGGRFVLNGEPIIVSREGLLNDGQHRLMAAVESGVTFRSLVVFGVPRSSRLTLDQGAARTVADYLDMEGSGENTKVAAAVARMLWQYRNFGRIATGGHTKSADGKKKRAWPTKAEIMQTAHECEREIDRSIKAISSSSRFAGSYSFVVFCRVLITRADETMGSVFIERLLDGSSLKADSPIFLLRERLINDLKMRPPERLEAVIRAWNAMRQGRTLSKIMIMGQVPKIEA